MAIMAIIAAAEAEAAAAAAAAATATEAAAATTAATTAASTAAAGAGGLGAGAGALGSMTGTGAGLAGSAAMAPEALAMQSLTAPGSLTGIMGGQGAMAPVEGILQGAEAAAPAMTPELLGQSIEGLPEGAFPGTSTPAVPSSNPVNTDLISAQTNIAQNALHSPLQPNALPGQGLTLPKAPITDVANIASAPSGLQAPSNYADIMGKGITTPTSMKTGLEAGFEKALSWAQANPMTAISGMQMLDRALAPGQPKKRPFSPGYSLSPNFKPTLAPSAPSGVYGRKYAEGGAVGQLPQQDAVGINSGYPMTQHTFPAYSGMPDGTGAGVEGYSDTPQFAQGGIARYADGGQTYGSGSTMWNGQYAADSVADAAKAVATPEYDINALYQKYLGRDADESGKKTYDPKKFTQQQLAGILQGSEEYKGQTLDPTEIQNAYKNVLQREVDPTGAAEYAGKNYSPGAFEDMLRQSEEYKTEVPKRVMERTVYRPEYEDYTQTPFNPGTAATTADQYMAMAKKGAKGKPMAKGGKTSDTNLFRSLAASGDEVTKADMDAITAYHQHAGDLAEDDDVDTRLLDPYSAAQVRLAKLSKKHKMEMAPVAKTNIDPANMAHGGITQNLGSYSDGGHLLKGPGDGMSDHIPATIGKDQPARLADGEFVIPADVVSHLGNGSTEAGAKQLYAMMSRIRKARTGNPKQGKQVNPRKLMPK